MMTDEKYIRDLEEVVKKMILPLKDISFSVPIKAISGYRVLPLEDNAIMRKLSQAFSMAGHNINKYGIISARVNEVGNKIEPFVKNALNKIGLKADTPANKNGTRISAGYPDIELLDKQNTYYIECKTYNIKNVDSSQRTFYFSPSSNSKITKDAAHLLLSFEVYVLKQRYYIKHWRLYSLEKLKVDLKHEFNQCNKNLYGNARTIDLICESDVE